MDPTFQRKMQKTSAMPLQTEGEPLDQSVSGHAASPRPGLGCSQMGSHGRTVYNNDKQVPPRFETPGFSQEMAGDDNSIDIDQICDENIQLFMKCEQYAQRQEEMRATVSDLEKQLAETKRKTAEIASRVELLRRQKLVG